MGEFATFLSEMALREYEHDKRAMQRAANIVKKDAKARIGEYHEAVGPFAGWQELADSTKADRTRQGFPENEPLLRTGEMRDSIGTRVDRDIAYIGSDSPIAEWQELGTVHIPPRSFLGAAAAANEEKIVEIIGKSAVASLTGDQVFQGELKIFDGED